MAKELRDAEDEAESGHENDAPGFVRSQAAATLVSPPVQDSTPTHFDRQAGKRKRDMERAEGHAAAVEAQQQQHALSRASAGITFDTLHTAPVSVLRALTNFRSMDALEKFYQYLDVYGELSDGTLTRYRWSSTHVALFHQEDGTPPEWVGEGLSAVEKKQLDSIRQRAHASDS